MYFCNIYLKYGGARQTGALKEAIARIYNANIIGLFIMRRQASKSALLLRSIFPIALAYFLAFNSLLGSFAQGAGASLGRDHGAAFTNLICAAAAIADGGAGSEAPGDAPAHSSHCCILCALGQQTAASDHPAIVPIIAPPPERSSQDLSLLARPAPPPPMNRGLPSNRSPRAPPATL